MGYFLTYEPENAPPLAVLASPKTHTPGARVSNLGLRFYNPDLGRWTSRDPIEEYSFTTMTHDRRVGSGAPLGIVGSSAVRKSRGILVLNLFAFVGDPVAKYDVLGLTSPPSAADVAAFSAAESANELALRGDLITQLKSMCPDPGVPVSVNPVQNRPQCCERSSCIQQAVLFAQAYSAHVTAVRVAEFSKYGDVLGGWAGNARRNAGGSPGLGGDGYLCAEWAAHARKTLYNTLLTYFQNHKGCFRGATVSKGDDSNLFDKWHAWFLIYSPAKTAPTYLATGPVLVIDPWESAGGEYIPSSPYTLDSHKFSACSERRLTAVRGRRRA